MSTEAFKEGDRVKKIGGDYTFVGVVVAAFKKLSGKQRYVVENTEGILHVFSDKQLIDINEQKHKE